MNFSRSPEKWSHESDQQMREEMRREDARNFKRGQDVRLEQGERLILRSPDGTQFKIEVDNAGVISATAI